MIHILEDISNWILSKKEFNQSLLRQNESKW